MGSVYAAHDPDKLSLILQAQSALESGIEITSLSNSGLDGVYAVDAFAQAV